MDEIPITGLEETERHLQQLVEDPETSLNAKLFDEVELQLTGKPKLFTRLQTSTSNSAFVSRGLWSIAFMRSGWTATQLSVHSQT
jgi:hypothetical protein